MCCQVQLLAFLLLNTFFFGRYLLTYFGVPEPSTEFRASFIATAFNVDWPTDTFYTSEEQQDQMRAFLDNAASSNFNAIVFQVRPAADAVYDSSIEPWSEALTGTQGQAPSPYYDPLNFVVTEAHARGLEVHAWLNPYRGSIHATFSGLASNHICNTLRQYCYIYSNYLWLDPGSSQVQDQLINVISDIVTRYDVDGIHFDDYFYPYPDGNDFPDGETYSEYQITGGTLTLEDWRRDNVNRMVERVYNTVHSIKTAVRFSISPFGIYRPGHPDGMPPPITGLDPYTEQYADTKLWLQQGWVDFFAPQLYWQISSTGQSYPALLDWWIQANSMNRHIYAANGWYRLVPGDGDWPVSEIAAQVDLSRDENRRSGGSLGNIGFSASQMRDNIKGLADTFRSLNQNIVPVSSYPWLLGANAVMDFDHSNVQIRNKSITVTLDYHVNTWMVFELIEDQMKLVRILPNFITDYIFENRGNYAVQARDKANNPGKAFYFHI